MPTNVNYNELLKSNYPISEYLLNFFPSSFESPITINIIRFLHFLTLDWFFSFKSEQGCHEDIIPLSYVKQNALQAVYTFLLLLNVIMVLNVYPFIAVIHNIRYPSECFLELKFREFPFVGNLFLRCQIALKSVKTYSLQLKWVLWGIRWTRFHDIWVGYVFVSYIPYCNSPERTKKWQNQITI